MSSSNAIRAPISSTLPAAPIKWPIMDFMELTGILCACLPRTSLIMKVSFLSFNGVEVPWALTYSMSSGFISASVNASLNALIA